MAHTLNLNPCPPSIRVTDWLIDWLTLWCIYTQMIDILIGLISWLYIALNHGRLTITTNPQKCTSSGVRMERIRYAAFLPNMKYVSVKIDDLLKCFTFIHCFLILEMVTVHPVFSVDHQTLLTHNHTIFPPTPRERKRERRSSGSVQRMA